MMEERMYSANEYADARDRILTLEAEVERLQAMIPTKPEGADRLFWLMKPVLAKSFTLGEED